MRIPKKIALAIITGILGLYFNDTKHVQADIPVPPAPSPSPTPTPSPSPSPTPPPSSTVTTVTYTYTTGSGVSQVTTVTSGGTVVSQSVAQVTSIGSDPVSQPWSAGSTGVSIGPGWTGGASPSGY
jgi:hypothetical protein